MRAACWLLALASARRNDTSGDTVEVLHVTGVVQHVDFSHIAMQPEALAATKESIKNFFTEKVCKAGEAGEEKPALLQELKLGRNTLLRRAKLLVESALLRNDTNGTNGTNGTNATAGPNCTGGEPVVILAYTSSSSGPAGNDVLGLVQSKAPQSMSFLIELEYSEAAEKALSDEGFPKEMSDYLLTVPQVILYADEPPIVPKVTVEKKEIESMVPGCTTHIPPLLAAFRQSYTNRMTPWALDSACGAFMTGLSFSTDDMVSHDDKVFCETASKHLMRTHFSASAAHEPWTHTANEDSTYEQWCHDVCEHKHGPLRVCALPAAAAPASEAAAEPAALLTKRSLRRMRRPLN